MGPDSQPTHKEPPFSSRVVVKFHDSVELPYEDGVEAHLGERGIGPWDELAGEFPGVSLRRLFSSLPPDRIRALVERAAASDPTYDPPNLLAYFVVDVPAGAEPEAVASVLGRWPSVQATHVNPVVEDAVDESNDLPWAPQQGYLYAAPDGVGARTAWNVPGGAWDVPGGDGAGQAIIAVERGVAVNHEDLSASVLDGPVTSVIHGTWMVGIFGMLDNDKGGIGIAPAIDKPVNVVCHDEYLGNPTVTYPTANAILTAIDSLGFGNVIEIAQQHIIQPGESGDDQTWAGAKMPVEADNSIYEVIKLATTLGIVVIEAAGNGQEDLDAYIDNQGNAILDRAAPGFRDSGAIVVSAADSASPHQKWATTNFGSRIDCYAWGGDITTSHWNEGAMNPSDYVTGEGKTSGASAIIAGAALSVQGMADATLGFRFSPKQLRAVLSDPSTGTLSANFPADKIGVMPNLQAIAQGPAVNTAPDVYIRDFLGDAGDAGLLFTSPDIILSSTQVADPQAEWGAGSGWEDAYPLGFYMEAEAGQDNYWYVRVRNRGGSDAADVEAKVFWAPTVTFLAPDLLTLAGSTTIPMVPAGEVLTVSGPITWPEAQIPGPGSYCCVALVGNTLDPAPDWENLPISLFWEYFNKWIAQNNNVGCSNFGVVDNVPDPAADPAGFVALEFLAPGAPDRGRRMRLEVGARLPEGGRAFLEVPLFLLDLEREGAAHVKTDPERGVGRLPVNPHGLHRLAEALFPARSRASCRLLVHIPERMRANEYRVFVRQVFDDQVVGRVTWRLAPPERRKRPP